MKHLLYLLFIGLALSAHAQNETDLYRFSKTTYSGSARFEAMGGSFGALGADLSSSQVNPAGYGRYSSSQIGITTYAGIRSNSTTFNDQSTAEKKGIGGISNFAIVLTEDASRESNGILYKQIGFGMNRIENFKETVHYKGQQYASLLDEFTGQAYGYEPILLNYYFPFSTYLGYESYAINYDPSTNSYYSLLNEGDVIHDRTVQSKGGQTELFVSYSANYMNKLYFGGNIGFRYHKYEELIDHKETLTDTTGTDLRGFNYKYDLRTSGWGTNLKIGVIYLVTEADRFGFAIHSPTFTELTDNFSADMSSEFKDSSFSVPLELLPSGNYKYRIRNPWRFIGSFAHVFSTKGCLNLDVEFLDYRWAHFKTTKDDTYTPYDYKIENTYAKTIFKPAVNLRLGGEYRVYSTIFIRGGIAYYGNSFTQEMEAENSPLFIGSTGFGIKSKTFTLDVAYKINLSNQNYFAFSNSVAEVQRTGSYLFISFALNF
jgi:hypothetical protein